MATEIVMPKLGATMEEGTIVSWLASIGEVIEEGDPIAEIQTDKIVIEIEAEKTGVLLKTVFEAGETVSVHEVIAYMGEKGEEIKDFENKEETSKKIKGSEEDSNFEKPKENNNEQYPDKNKKIRRTPAARKYAEENQVDLHEIVGSGPNGRIQKKDVLNYLEKLKEATEKDEKNYTSNSVNRNFESEAVEIEKRVPFKGMRKAIANRMVESVATSPHVTLLTEIDMSNCVSLRQELLPITEQMDGVRLSYNDILIKATGFALKQNPNMNISLDGEEIVHHAAINIGIAVAVSGGLVVPVIRNVDQKGLAVITKEAKNIGKQAREGKLLPESMQGSTFSISNLGMYAVDGFTPIINSPNAGILGVGRIQEKAVVINSEIKIRSMMSLSLSFDHRIIDGAPAALFLTDLKEVLENPYKLML